MFEEYLKHLRQKPTDNRLTVKTECGVRVINLLTTDRIERAGCACSGGPTPGRLRRKGPPNPKHHALRRAPEDGPGEDFTDRDGNTQDNLPDGKTPSAGADLPPQESRSGRKGDDPTCQNTMES